MPGLKQRPYMKILGELTGFGFVCAFCTGFEAAKHLQCLPALTSENNLDIHKKDYT